MALEDIKKYYGMSRPDANNLGNFILRPRKCFLDIAAYSPG